MSDGKTHVDPVYITFSTVMRVLTIIGIVVMMICGLLYLAGINPYLDTSLVANNWGKSATLFWKDVKGIKVNNYSWFLLHLRFMDSVSMIGVCLLALTPLISIVVMIPKSKRIYAILLSILVAEFIFSIIRPVI